MSSLAGDARGGSGASAGPFASASRVRSLGDGTFTADLGFYTAADLDLAAEVHPTVLVVEDEPAIRGLLAEFLRGEGYEVALARDGSEALDLLSEDGVQHHPSIVLLDMMLPEVDGVSVLKQLAANGPQVPVVAMSASYEALGAALAAGANAAVPKPFDLDGLLVTLERQTLTAA